MHLIGLPFAQLLGIFAVAGAVVVGLYILKLRRRPVAVPFEQLWERILKDKEATSLFSRLKRLLSLLLQLAILAALVLALGDPRTAIEVVKGRTLVVLVDTSASMGALRAKGGRRIDAAREEARTIARGLGGSDRMLVASLDAVVTPRSPLTGDAAALEEAIATLEPTDTRADLARGLRFALDTLRGAKQPEVVVISDGALEEARDALGPVHLGDTKLSFVPIAGEGRNIGITQFAVRRYPLDRARYEVMIEVRNFGATDEDVELALHGDDVLVDLTKLHLKAGERLPRFYPSLGGASRTLEARLGIAPKAANLPAEQDDLPADDRAFAVLPERRRTKVLAVTPGNTYLEAALLLDEYLDVTTVSPDGATAALAAAKYDVAIYDGTSPPLRPGLPALYLDAREGGPIKVDQKKPLVEPGFDRLERKHPILRWTALENVNVATGFKLVPAEGDKVVGASADGPILVAGSRAGTKFVTVGFDVRQSDLPLRIAWPVFLLNTINWFVEEDADYLSSFKTGEVWHVPAPIGSGAEATMIGPKGDQHRVPIQDGRAIFFGTRAGFHRLTKGDGATKEPSDVIFAANLADPVESAIAPRAELVVDGRKGGEISGFQVGVRKELWIYLLAAVAMISAIEWATYHRRVTV
jgi:hypothetical protein